MNTEQKPIPDGFMQDAQGRLVPRDNVSDFDQLRDDLVNDCIRKAQEMREELAAFRRKLMEELHTFIDLAGEKYGVKMGGIKGNVTLTSFDGKRKVLIAVQERIFFDERIQVAKELVDRCIHRWTEGSRSEIKALVEHAFQTDQEGRISIGRILSLTRLQIDDAEWKTAMEAIRDSMQVADTKSYVRFYERRSPEDKFRQIAIDLASL